MTKPAEHSKSRAHVYRGRAEEFRALADQLKSQEHKRLLFESAQHYEKMAEAEANEAARRNRMA